MKSCWVVSPNLASEKKGALVGWKKIIRQKHAAVMGWSKKHEIGRRFVDEIADKDVILIARPRRGKPEIVGFGIVRGNAVLCEDRKECQASERFDHQIVPGVCSAACRNGCGNFIGRSRAHCHQALSWTSLKGALPAFFHRRFQFILPRFYPRRVVFLGDGDVLVSEEHRDALDCHPLFKHRDRKRRPEPMGMASYPGVLEHAGQRPLPVRDRALRKAVA